jgi:hypothetical protein
MSFAFHDRQQGPATAKIWVNQIIFEGLVDVEIQTNCAYKLHFDCTNHFIIFKIKAAAPLNWRCSGC